MKRIRTTLYCVLTLAPLIGGAHAQNDEPSALGGTAVGALIGGAVVEERGIDLEFKGGTLKEFVKVIEAQSPETINIVVPIESEGAFIPELKVNNVEFEEIVATLEVLMTEPGESNPPFQFLQTGRNIWTFHQARYLPAPGEAVPPPPLPEAKLCTFSLNDLLEVYEMSDIVTLITTVWKTGNLPEPENMTVHEETSMLLMKANEEQQRVVSELLQQLTIASESKRKSQHDRDRFKQAYEAELQKVKLESDQKAKVFETEIRRMQEQLLIVESRHAEEISKYRVVTEQLEKELRDVLAKMKSDK